MLLEVASWKPKGYPTNILADFFKILVLSVRVLDFDCIVSFPASMNSNYNRPKDPSALDSHSTRSKRTELQVSGKQKSRL